LAPLVDPKQFAMLEALRRREACHTVITDARGIIVPNELPWLYPKQPENLSVPKTTSEPPGANGEKAMDEDEDEDESRASEPESLERRGLSESDCDAADATKDQVEVMKAVGMDEISSPITDKKGLEDSEDSGSPTHPSEDIEEATKLKAEKDPYDISMMEEVPSGDSAGEHTAKGGIFV
jgi:hypothetical protein